MHAKPIYGLYYSLVTAVNPFHYWVSYRFTSIVDWPPDKHTNTVHCDWNLCFYFVSACFKTPFHTSIYLAIIGTHSYIILYYIIISLPIKGRDLKNRRRICFNKGNLPPNAIKIKIIINKNRLFCYKWHRYYNIGIYRYHAYDIIKIKKKFRVSRI